VAVMRWSAASTLFRRCTPMTAASVDCGQEVNGLSDAYVDLFFQACATDVHSGHAGMDRIEFHGNQTALLGKTPGQPDRAISGKSPQFSFQCFVTGYEKTTDVFVDANKQFSFHWPIFLVKIGACVHKFSFILVMLRINETYEYYLTSADGFKKSMLNFNWHVETTHYIRDPQYI
jgi:hypothetical protein